MLAVKARSSLLLRGSAALVLMLGLWWLVLLKPSLFLLRHSTEFAMRVLMGGGSDQVVSVADSGDWNFSVPVGISGQYVPQEHRSVNIRSIGCTVTGSDLRAFTFSVPVLWAIFLAAPWRRKSLRPLLIGTVLTGCVQVLSLLLFVDIAAHRGLAVSLQISNSFSTWWMTTGDYLALSVIPFLAPFIIAIALNRDLRTEILNWSTGEPACALNSPQRDGRHGSRKKKKHGKRLTAGLKPPKVLSRASE
ncbi:MAG TPA: exosortase H-associated membrane protein [Bryobacteraceae bacterium]|jgi:hypothetical protein|nr:exosortase H-associated membrane protein [Bryobacteraceae bacterium]